MATPTPRINLLGQGGDDNVDRKGFVPAEDPFKLVGRLAVVVLPELIDIGLTDISTPLLGLLLDGLADYFLQVHGLQLSTGVNYQCLEPGVFWIFVGDLPKDVFQSLGGGDILRHDVAPVSDGHQAALNT